MHMKRLSLMPLNTVTSAPRAGHEWLGLLLAAGRQARREQLLLRVWSAEPGGEGGTRFLVLDNTPKK